MSRFDGKRVFVTGAASGIGAATVELFRKEGATVVGTDVQKADGIAFCDVTDPASVSSAMDSAVKELGGLDIHINVAGVDIFSKFEDLSLDLVRKHIDVNYIGSFLATHAALPHLRKSKGNIVTVASISGIQGQPYNAAYCASKGALVNLAKQAAIEHAPDAIRVNVVAPSATDTGLFIQVASQAPDPDAIIKMVASRNPMGRLGTAAEVCDAVAFLASDRSTYISGTVIPLDGAMAARRS